MVNQRQETAETAQINFDLFQEGEKVESITLQINYIQVNFKEIGWIVFTTKRKGNDSLAVSSPFVHQVNNNDFSLLPLYLNCRINALSHSVTRGV